MNKTNIIYSIIFLGIFIIVGDIAFFLLSFLCHPINKWISGSPSLMGLCFFTYAIPFIRLIPFLIGILLILYSCNSLIKNRKKYKTVVLISVGLLFLLTAGEVFSFIQYRMEHNKITNAYRNIKIGMTTKEEVSTILGKPEISRPLTNLERIASVEKRYGTAYPKPAEEWIYILTDRTRLWIYFDRDGKAVGIDYTDYTYYED